MTKQFGGKITKELEGRYSQSKQWRNKKFTNIEETNMDISPLQIPKLLYKQFFEKAGREPKARLPVLPIDKEAFLRPSEKMKFIWYGHSVILMRIANKTILIDPMLGPNAAPITPFPIKRFSENTLDLIQDFPKIDLLLLTHDHYDHLDLDRLKLLMPKVKEYYVALGCSRHLEKWGISNEKIKEFDWWSSANFDGIDITFTPTRHFSGRGLTDRAKSLWGGWILKTETENIYFSGDSGYGDHFKEVGEKLGPFDFAFMECGQYNENWHQIHMFPEESVQAAKVAGARVIMPVHWAGFALAQHHWKDPLERFVKACKDTTQRFIVPLLGEIVASERTESSLKSWIDLE
jgi:L-ascorbate metabolism protein UlaG (beta-lactamase superfamily)